MFPSNMPYGDPMLYWYQDYCARLQQQGKSQNGAAAVPGAPGAPGANNTVPNNTTASPTQARPVAVPPVPPIFKVESRKPPGGIGPFKWWQDPKAVFAPPGTKEVLKRVQAETGTRQEGNEVESAPPSEDATAEEDTQPAKKATRKNNTKNNTKKNTKKNTTTNTTNDGEENAEAEDQPAAKPTPRARRPRKRLLKDPVAAASSGTSVPLPHYSSDGTNPRQHDAVGNVAKLLMDLGIPLDGAKLTELANVMCTPIDAPADYLTTHYGRWKHVRTVPCVRRHKYSVEWQLGKSLGRAPTTSQVLDDEWAAQFFEAVRPALEAFEYELDGLHIKPKDNTAMLPRWLAMQEAAAASAV